MVFFPCQRERCKAHRKRAAHVRGPDACPSPELAATFRTLLEHDLDSMRHFNPAAFQVKRACDKPRQRGSQNEIKPIKTMPSFKSEITDSFVSLESVMKTGNRAPVESIQWEGILNHRLASEKVIDIRGRTIPGLQNIVDCETESSLSVMKSRYTLMQPSRFKEMIAESLEGVPHKITMAGTFNGRRNIILGVELTGMDEFLVGGDAKEKHHCHLMYGGSADGSTSLWTAQLINRASCSNQFARIIRGATKAKNTESGEAKFGRIIESMPSLLAYRNAYCEALADMKNEAIAHDDARAFMVATVNEGKTISAQAFKLSDQIFNLFTSGIGNNGETRADVFNGFTEHFTHSAAKRANACLGSSLIGDGAAIKRDVFEALNPYKGEFVKRVERGHKLLKDAKAEWREVALTA